MLTRREAARRSLEESDSSSDVNEDLASESTAPPFLPIIESQDRVSDLEESEDESSVHE